MDYVYHYTIGSHLSEIHACAELRPSNAGAPEEKPLIWFSAHPFWEPSVQKPMLLARGIFLLSFEQTRDMLGCVRFALPRSDRRLMDRHAAYGYAGTPRAIRKNLEALGRRDGANPDDWMAVTAPLALQELRLEFLDGDEWTEVSVSASASKRRPEPSIQFLPNLRKFEQA